jgi:hypothetical protein
MVTLRDVLSIVAEIDDILAREFGGKGRGIHRKLDSVHPALPNQLDKRLRYFEAVRNKALMQPDWRIPDRTHYITECQAAARRRRRMLAPLQRLRGMPGSFAIVMAAVGALLLLVSGAISFSA